MSTHERFTDFNRRLKALSDSDRQFEEEFRRFSDLPSGTDEKKEAMGKTMYALAHVIFAHQKVYPTKPRETVRSILKIK